MPRLCCALCFGDRGIKKELIPLFSEGNGQCGYCQSVNQELIHPNNLANYFELLVSIYRISEDGRRLIEWLREDWALFEAMDSAHANELLADIFNDGEIVRSNFSPVHESNNEWVSRWEELKEELMHRNRFFPTVQVDEKRIEVLLSHLIVDLDEMPNVWYRARIQRGSAAYSVEQMGAPPQRIASHGRANPAGIPYLYLASTPSTAITEVRPHPGEIVCVAEFSVVGDLKLVDLRDPRKLVSPFLLGDEEDIALLRGDISFLEKLGKELTTPVSPTAAAIDYIPSQYLCEFIKKCQFDGVVYKSSVNGGINLALFQTAYGSAQFVEQHAVSAVDVASARIESPN